VEPVDLRTNLNAFVTWRTTHLRGDEKGEAQTFLDRFFKAFGHEGAIEAGAVYEERIKRYDYLGVGYADLVWKPRVLIEMKKAGADLSRHFRQAFEYWQRCVPDRPRYVVLCNFDEFWVYDFDQQLDAPMDVVKIEDLPQRYEALAFMLPDEAEPIFGNDLVEVTREAAAQVSGVFRSMVERGLDRMEAQHFVLQSVVAMFSEDIGLLPSHFFSRTVNEARNGREAYDLLGSLFREMNAPERTRGGRFEGTPYFNGGLFENIQPIEMTDSELSAIRLACLTNWSAVRPEIFGTLFETSMEKGERHAYGAHFTSQADIMKVIGPCIVQPWLNRIDAAKNINELERLLLDMASYRVLDPACGSGNFLYVAYREMRRLEAEVKRRIDERRKSTNLADQAALSYVTTDHFLGLDNNRFAVEVAKVTLMMAKKLAADEVEGGQEDVLPLDNLDETILCGDALFKPWPKADVIIGNPPYNGRRKMARDLGTDYVARLDRKWPSPGVSDFVTYWFPLAHDALPTGGRAGFVATQAIRDGASRIKSLDYIVDHDGVITEAVSVQPWSGDAVVHVSIVNWVKGKDHAPAERVLWINDGDVRMQVAEIGPNLRTTTNVRTAKPLPGNRRPQVHFQGQTTGYNPGYRLTDDQARALFLVEPQARDVVHPQISGDPMLHTMELNTCVVDIPIADLQEAKHKYPKTMEILTDKVLPYRREKAAEEAAKEVEARRTNPDATTARTHRDFLERSWWMQWRRRGALMTALERVDRYIALTRVAAYDRMSVYVFVDPSMRPDDSLATFALDDDYSFGILTSTLHRVWFDERGTQMKVDPRYTSTTVWDSFPWPADPDPEIVKHIAELSRCILDTRDEYLAEGITLAKMYDTLRDPGETALRTLHADLDVAVLEAYRFDPEMDWLAQLLALNLAGSKDPTRIRRPGGHGLEGVYTSTGRIKPGRLRD
jgi:hypothetical protein